MAADTLSVCPMAMLALTFADPATPVLRTGDMAGGGRVCVWAGHDAAGERHLHR